MKGKLKNKLQDSKVWKWTKEKFPDIAGKGLELFGDLTGRESVENFGQWLQDKDLPEEDKKEIARLVNEEIKLLNEDRQSARNREIEIAKTKKSDWMMNVTGLIGLGLLVFIVVCIVFIPRLENNEMLIHTLGIIEGVSISIFYYYFGYSKQKRD